MSFFGKKKDYNYDDNYDNDFYRGGEEDGVVGGDEDGEELTAPAAPATPKKPAPKAGSKSAANAGALIYVTNAAFPAASTNDTP